MQMKDNYLPKFWRKFSSQMCNPSLQRCWYSLISRHVEFQACSVVQLTELAEHWLSSGFISQSWYVGWLRLQSQTGCLFPDLVWWFGSDTYLGFHHQYRPQMFTEDEIYREYTTVLHQTIASRNCVCMHTILYQMVNLIHKSLLLHNGVVTLTFLVAFSEVKISWVLAFTSGFLVTSCVMPNPKSSEFIPSQYIV